MNEQPVPWKQRCTSGCTEPLGCKHSCRKQKLSEVKVPYCIEFFSEAAGKSLGVKCLMKVQLYFKGKDFYVIKKAQNTLLLL